MRPTATITSKFSGPPETVSICPSHGAAMMHVVSIALADRDASVRICPECLDLLFWRKVALAALAIQEDAGLLTRDRTRRYRR
jgi:hypothetical protein